MDVGSTFSAAHIAITAGIIGLTTAAVVVVLLRPARLGAIVGVALTTTVATFGWRMVANVGALNQDGVSWVSANDVLAPALTYMSLGMYATFVVPANARRFEKLRAALFTVALVVNILAI
jgi:hypothetical protein